jgi:hypothetical protein
MKKILLACALACAPALADESKITLKNAPAKDLVAASCGLCHSLDYIPMNSVFLDRKGWEASVNKMIKVMGAPIKDDEAPKIVDYLASQYGK